jgi:hypothetical protein
MSDIFYRAYNNLSNESCHVISTILFVCYFEGTYIAMDNQLEFISNPVRAITYNTSNIESSFIILGYITKKVNSRVSIYTSNKLLATIDVISSNDELQSFEEEFNVFRMSNFKDYKYAYYGIRKERFSINDELLYGDVQPKIYYSPRRIMLCLEESGGDYSILDVV